MTSALSMVQTLDAMVEHVYEGFKQIQDQLQLDRSPTDEESLKQIREDIAKCHTGIQQMESIQMDSEIVQHIRDRLKKRQREEALLLSAMRTDMCKAADRFKQALCKRLQHKHAYLTDSFK